MKSSSCSCTFLPLVFAGWCSGGEPLCLVSGRVPTQLWGWRYQVNVSLLATAQTAGGVELKSEFNSPLRILSRIVKEVN